MHAGTAETANPAAGADPSADGLVSQLVGQMASAWERGERRSAEELLARHPELADQPEAAARLIYEEVCLRQEAGEKVTTAEVCRRFPRWRAELEALFACYRLLEPPAPTFPGVGETLADLRIVAEIDRGARGRVFLASQASLADRPLVLKVTPEEGAEHYTLARLQHTHIVPLYFAHEFPDRHLRVLGMPYLGGTTLRHLLETLTNRPVAERTGRDLLDALDGIPTAAPLPVPGDSPVRKFLRRASYAQAISWIGVCLGEALQYAHERGLVHLDVKPSNVLLTAEGQPMLLDFHLAREPIHAGSPAPDWLGGTAEYMSPEQRQAMQAVLSGQPVAQTVDGRSDLHSLGMVLYEALSGAAPPPAGQPLPRLERWNCGVTPGLADVIHRCLEPAPAARYPDAAALTDDLKRHLNDLPLRGVPNRSLVERWRKWRRRRPQLLVLIPMLAALLAVLVIAAFLVRTREQAHQEHRVQQADAAARAALEEGQRLLHEGRHADAARVLTQGLSLAQSLPADHSLLPALQAQLERARRAQEEEHLHGVAEQLRLAYGLDLVPGGQLQTLAREGRSLWDARRQLLEKPGLAAGDDGRVRDDLFDLAVLWADLAPRVAAADRAAAARKEALEVLAEAEALFGPSPVLCQERQLHAQALGLTALAREAARAAAHLAPRTAWEHYALGRFLFGSGDLERAAAELQQAVALRPQDFWAHYYQGVCAYQRRLYDLALVAFEVCGALAPERGECYYNRALTRAALGQPQAALEDYARALHCHPALPTAAINRAILLDQLGRHAEARAALQQALSLGADPATAYYNLALVSLHARDRTAAWQALHEAQRHHLGEREARELEDRLRSRR